MEFVRYGGQTSCIALAHDGAAGPTLVLDAGTGLRRVTALLGGQPFNGTILLTHLHWDHVHGLPFFAAGDRDGARASLLLPAQPDGASAADVLARGMSRRTSRARPTACAGTGHSAQSTRKLFLPDGEAQRIWDYRTYGDDQVTVGLDHAVRVLPKIQDRFADCPLPAWPSQPWCANMSVKSEGAAA